VTPSAPPAVAASIDFGTPTAAPLSDPGQARFLTGEAVHVDVRVARLGSRVVARLIDFVLQVVLAGALFLGLLILLGLAAAAGIVRPETPLIQAILIVTIVASIIGYPVAMETLTRGRTFGKMVLGLRVVRDDGGPVMFRHAFARGLIAAAIEFPGFAGAPLTWLATLPVMLASPQGKRLGDHVAGTVVIHERTPSAWGWVPRMPPELAGWAATLDLAGLDDNVALSVRQYLARNREIREPARTQLGQLLAREVAAVTNPPAPPGVPGWAYLAAVHAERHRRSQHQLAAVRRRSATVWPELAWSANSSPTAYARNQTNSARPQ
jgi:uncharacterized RDD family membrane protein YckC